jgi:hypothetical protein
VQLALVAVPALRSLGWNSHSGVAERQGLPLISRAPGPVGGCGNSWWAMRIVAKLSDLAATVDCVHDNMTRFAEGTADRSPTPAAADMSYAGFAQRVKALATTAPLHDLDARKTSVQAADYSAYQMAELALHTIDLVTVAMDFDTGARPDEVLRNLIGFVVQQAPGRPSSEHERVAAWVLENLLNVGSADRGFRTVYGHQGPGGYDRRTFDFKILEEALGADGERYLRASNEAINVLVGALEVDLEAAHIAADVRLDILIKRGRLDEAQAAAQNARYRTIAYGESLRRHLDATTRDVRTVDWLTAMPEFLRGALEHVEDRYRAENAILVNITQIRDTADDPGRKRQAARLVALVRDCLRRNDQLSAGLQAAGRTFRAEQDRQSFTAGPAVSTLDLHAQLLQPVLTLPIGDADGPLDSFFQAANGVQVPPALRLADLFDALITPPAERDTLGEAITEPDLDDTAGPDRFPDASYEHLDQLLSLDPDAPQRLSGLLADARTREADDPAAEDLALLVVVRVLALAAQEIASARRHHDSHVLMAVDDGEVLEDPDFAGADLLVARAALRTPEEVQAASAHTTAQQAGSHAPADTETESEDQIAVERVARDADLTAEEGAA